MKNYIIGGIAVLALVLSIVGLVSDTQSVQTVVREVAVKTKGVTNYDQIAIGATTTVNSRFNLTLGAASATTTIFAGRLCIVTQALNSGTDYLYYYPATSTANASVSGWATSTTPCY